MLVSPENFGLVEPGVYRCTKLKSDNFPFLETLQLKSLLLLDVEKPPRMLHNFLDSNNIELFSLGSMKILNHNHTGEGSLSKKESQDNLVGSDSNTYGSSVQKDGFNELEVVLLEKKTDKNDQWMLIERNLITAAFDIIFNKNKHNLLLVDSTSTLVGILRKIQKWNFNSILGEYRIYNGSTGSSNYFAESFLELIQLDLVSYEVDQVVNRFKHRRDSNKFLHDGLVIKSPDFSNYRGLRKSSVDYESACEIDDVNSIDDDDEMDEDLLSGSPQIPANLLKLVEQKKQEKTRESEDSINATSSAIKIGRLSRNNSFSSDILMSSSFAAHDRRRSSIDSRFMRNNASKLRNQNSPTPSSHPARSFEGNSPTLRKVKDKDMNDISNMDVELIMQKYDYKYYHNLQDQESSYADVRPIKFKLPPENKLPDWFIRGRNHWESNYIKLNRK